MIILEGRLNMNKGFLLYNQKDYVKNKWFADEFIKNAPYFQMEIKLLLTEQLIIGTANGNVFAEYNGERLETPKFVINRSRNAMLGFHFELMGSKVFNSSKVTDICNHKGKTHQLINSHGIPSVKTIIPLENQSITTAHARNFPIIVKSTSGHGGNEVFLVNNQEQLNHHLSQMNNDVIIQEMCTNPGIDIRVFVMGNEVIGAVKRFSNNSFKSNVTLGGHSEKYTLTSEEHRLVKRMMTLLDFDFVGIDFILDENEQFLFNEIEDVVGTRTLYKHYEIDVVQTYLKYIKKQL